MRTFLIAMSALALMFSAQSVQAQSCSDYKQFERDWIKDIQGPCTFKGVDVAARGFTLTAVVPAHGPKPMQVNFKCSPLRESVGEICGITNISSQSHRGIHLTGTPERLLFGNPWDQGKWVDLNVRRREGKTMP